jgi:hypothetical protein
MTKVSSARIRSKSYSKDEIIVADRLFVSEADKPFFNIHARDFRHQHICITLSAQHMANRCCNVGRRQARRRHLIQQRLKQMMVRAVNHGNADRRFRERKGGVQSAEPPAHDNHMGMFLLHNAG